MAGVFFARLTPENPGDSLAAEAALARARDQREEGHPPGPERGQGLVGADPESAKSPKPHGSNLRAIWAPAEQCARTGVPGPSLYTNRKEHP